MDVREYTRFDAVGLAELIEKGEVSAGEVQAAAREAIAKVDPAINAVVGDVFDQPLAYAADGPFRGVPFALKDLVCHAAGVPSEGGSRLTEGLTFPHDTHLMARWRAAGLATMCRTNTPENGFNASTEPLANGPTANPWDTARSAGGSSGGSGALVAAGAVPVAHANDGGGSIRIPAALCGLVGLKPTRGRTPVGPDSDDPLYGLAIEFAVTRTVRDTAALLDAVEGPEPGDRFAIRTPRGLARDEVGADPGRLRVAWTTTAWNGAAVDPACAAVTEATANQLERLGHAVERGSPSVDNDRFDIMNIRFWCGYLAYNVRQLARLTGHDLSSDVLEHTVRVCAELGDTFTAYEMIEASAIQNAITRAVGGFFVDVDVLVTPTVSRPPWLLGELDADDASLDAPAWLDKVFTYCPFTALFNATGQPAISLPLGWHDGLPIGVQLVARAGREDLLIRVAAQLEEAMPWADRRPPILSA